MVKIDIEEWKEWADPPGETVYCAKVTLVDPANPIRVVTGADTDKKTGKLTHTTAMTEVRETVQVRRASEVGYKKALDAVVARMQEDIAAGYPDRTPEPPSGFKEDRKTRSISV